MSDALDFVSVMMVFLTARHLLSWQLEWLSLPGLLRIFRCQVFTKASLPLLKFSGPYHHKLLNVKSSIDIPRDSKSAGFFFVLTWFHSSGANNLWISLILLATNAWKFLLRFLTHHKTFILSVHSPPSSDHFGKLLLLYLSDVNSIWLPLIQVLGY